MRLPCDLYGADIVRYLGRLGHTNSGQTGRHIRLTCSASAAHGEHHVTIPNRDPLQIGKLASIRDSVAVHHGMTRDQLLQQLLG